MIKKIVLIASVLLCLFSINTLAIQVDKEFYIYGQNDKEICDAIGMSEGELKEYCKQNSITFLAVDKDNKRQIRKTEIKDEFSEKIGNFWALSQDEIADLADEITGFDNVKGTVEEGGDKRYLKVELKTKDSGGEYILTQYITVENSKKEILTFYTDIDTSTDYIEKAFDSQFKVSGSASVIKTLSIIGIVLFSALAIVVMVAIIKDTFEKKPTE